MKIDTIIIASNNQGKIKEIKDILAPVNIQILSLKEANISSHVEEDMGSFKENAIKKAKAVCNLSGKWALADDSGLVVEALGGQPGIFSARFAGEDADDERNRKKLLSMMRDIPPEQRKAYFYCYIVLLAPDGYMITSEGRCDGYITYEEMGDNGFGYDPIFWVPEYKKTFAQLDASIKNTISHRARALKALKDKLLYYIEG